jgi:competence protein ComGC
MRRFKYVTILILLCVVSVSVASAAGSVDEKTVARLERLIQSQQQQLELQQQQLHDLQQQMSQFKSAGTVTQSTEAKTASINPTNKGVTSGSDKVKLVLSGQIHRAINIVDDGDNTEAYFVDSAASNSRFRLVGSAELPDDLTLGLRMEIAVAPNISSDVNQNNSESGDYFDQRYTDLSLATKGYGQLFLGKGDTSSNNTAEVDLSGTDLVQYASIADIAGGMLFVRSDNDDLTKISVSDAFKDFDGLSRKSRLRYDTPTFYGAHLSTSWISDKRWDASLWWGGQGSGFKAAAAAAVAYINTERNGDDSDYQYDGSFSILHEATGLNFTFSAGKQEVDNQGDPANIWGKIGWKTDLVSYGQTAFGVDYGESTNLVSDRDDGYSYGATVVQAFNNYGAEFYAQYRVFSLDHAATDVEDINVATVGTRVKF